MPGRRILCGLVLSAGCLLAEAFGFVLQSPSLQPGAAIPMDQIYRGDGCNGRNMSPALAWRHPPPGTRSFAVTIFDPDAPTGFGWWHWVVLDLPPSTRALAAGAGAADAHALPRGALELRNSYGTRGYGGPCPPPGSAAHHYRFTVYALDVRRLALSADASAKRAIRLIRAHALGRARFSADFGRP